MANEQTAIERQQEEEKAPKDQEKAATPKGEVIDMNDEAVMKRLFEEKNRDKNLYYTSLGVNWFKFLERELRNELNINESEPAWNLDVKVIWSMIDRLRYDEQRDFLDKLYWEFLDFTKLRPYVQSPFYGYFYEMIGGLAEEIVETEKEVRQQVEVWDIEFNAPTDEMSSQDWNKIVEEKERVKQEYLKKAKKKKWGQEEEKAALEQVAQKV